MIGKVVKTGVASFGPAGQAVVAGAGILARNFGEETITELLLKKTIFLPLTLLVKNNSSTPVAPAGTAQIPAPSSNGPTITEVTDTGTASSTTTRAPVVSDVD